MPKRVTSGWAAPKTRRSVGDTVFDLTGPVIEPETSRTDSDVLNSYAYA